MASLQQKRLLIASSFAPGWVLRAGSIPSNIYLDFVNNRAWTNRNASIPLVLNCTRATPADATYTNAAGVISYFAANVLRYGTSGLLVEESRTNVVLQNRDLTNAAWTKTNCTPAKNQTGPDNVANSASLLTATAGNATCLQAITLGSSARFQTAYIKRITGSGVVEMTMDNGTTWTAVTVTSSWTRVSIPTQTLANPTVGFRIVTSGDAVAIDLVQNENGAFATSAIVVAGTAVTRAADNISFASTSGQLLSRGTWYAGINAVAGNVGAAGRVFAQRVDNTNIVSTFRSSGNLLAFETLVGSTTAQLVSASAVAAGNQYKIASAYETNNVGTRFTPSLGANPSDDVSCAMPTGAFTTYIGSLNGTTQFFNDYILSLAHWTDRRVSNTGLSGLVA